jgi:tetratricopeptide (TPR) repeat protein
MQSKLLILVLVVAFLFIPAVLAEDTSEWNTYGQTALTTGDYANAIKFFDYALAQDKNYVPALTGKAIALNAMGQYDSALISANQSLLIRSQEQDALNAKAYALYKLNRLDESVSAYNSLFTVQVNRVDAYCNQGNAYLIMNKSAEAVGSYSKCTTLDPLNFMSWNNLGVAYMNLGKYPDALSAFNEATGLTVKNATVWNNEGKVLVLMGKSSDALQCFDKALGIDPGFADAQINHNNLYGKLQVVNITGTVTPTVTISRIGTFYTTVIPTEPAVSAGSTMPVPPAETTSDVTETTIPVTKKTTYSPLPNVIVLCAMIAAGAIAKLMKR